MIYDKKQSLDINLNNYYLEVFFNVNEKYFVLFLIPFITEKACLNLHGPIVFWLYHGARLGGLISEYKV